MLKDFIVLSFIVLAPFMVLNAGLLVFHEEMHAEIYQDYGCTDVSIEYFPDPLDGLNAVTTANCDITDSDRSSMEKEHRMVHKLVMLGKPVVWGLAFIVSTVGLSIFLRET